MRSVVRVYLGPPGKAHGAVAQLGERRFCKAEAVGSIPISSMIKIRKLKKILEKQGPPVIPIGCPCRLFDTDV